MLYSKIKGLKFLKYFDMLIPSVALAQGFGRIGCFLAGCCYGRETDSPFGIIFHESQYAPNGVRLVLYKISLFTNRIPAPSAYGKQSDPGNYRKNRNKLGCGLNIEERDISAGADDVMRERKMKKYDVMIIGAGVSGSASVFR